MIATVVPGVVRAVSSVNLEIVVEKTLKVPATCALPVVTAPWIRFMTCALAAMMLVMVVHVRVEPVAPVPGAKALFAFVLVEPKVLSMLGSAALKYMKGRGMMILPPIVTGVVDVGGPAQGDGTRSAERSHFGICSLIDKRNVSFSGHLATTSDCWSDATNGKRRVQSQPAAGRSNDVGLCAASSNGTNHQRNDLGAGGEITAA